MKKKIIYIGIIFIIVLFTIYFSQIINLLLKKNNDKPFDITWSENGIPICVKPEFQSHARICSDGEGGVIITWGDPRNGYGTDDIYAQRIDSNGKALWRLDGTIVCGINGMQRNPNMVSDGAGGAIITWWDYRNGEDDINVYAQKINSEGVIQWTNSGIPICNAKGCQRHPQICSDGADGAIIAWIDDTPETYEAIYAQRIDSNGNLKWIPNGTAICTKVGVISYLGFKICSDGAGGAIIAWSERIYNNYDIFAQKIDFNGIIKWTANGTPICTEINPQILPDLCLDDSGGAIITWKDERIEDQNYVYTQRIDYNGNIKWIPNGTHLYTCEYVLGYPKICSDGYGGAFITWSDVNRVFVQRISSTGMKLWIENCTIDNNDGQQTVYDPRIYSDRNGGAIITFIYTFDIYAQNNDIYAQKIDGNGNFLWTEPALPICTAEYRQGDPDTYCDGKGNVFFVWADNRANLGDNADIYAQHVFYIVESNQVIPFEYFYSIIIILDIISLVIINKHQMSYRY